MTTKSKTKTCTRLATASDAALLTLLDCEGEEWEFDLFQHNLRLPRHRAAILFEGGNAIGFALYATNPKNDLLILLRLHILRRHRCRGKGTRLLWNAIGAGRCELGSPSIVNVQHWLPFGRFEAIEFLKANGFVASETVTYARSPYAPDTPHFLALYKQSFRFSEAAR